MSADAHVASSRLRPPLNLSSSSLPGRRSAPHRLLTSSAAYRGWRGDDRDGDPALLVPGLDSDGPDQHGDIAGDARDFPDWIDLDRYEDWERPTLTSLCPTIRIPYEDDLFPVAVAEDGESLPAEIHPSHPYGNLHTTTASYVSRAKVPSRRGLAFQAAEEADSRHHTDASTMPAYLSIRSRQGIAPNTPTWPFKRFGPGPGGSSALTRAESKRPWRPYKAVWADLGLEELLPQRDSVRDSSLCSDSETERAYLPQEGEISNVEIVLQEMEEFESQLPTGDEDTGAVEKDKKKKRRVQKEWQWGQRAGSRTN